MPTPASQPEPQRFASPVPRYSVSWFLSPGSSVRAPTEFWSSSFGLTCCQSGLPALALLVRHTPPPAAPIQRRQDPCALQSGSTTSAVVRLAVVFVAPVNARTPGSTAFSFGATWSHFLPPAELNRASPFDAIAAKLSSAFCTWSGVTVEAG